MMYDDRKGNKWLDYLDLESDDQFCRYVMSDPVRPRPTPSAPSAPSDPVRPRPTLSDFQGATS